MRRKRPKLPEGSGAGLNTGGKWKLRFIEFNGKHPRQAKENRVYSDRPDASWTDYGAAYPEGFLKVDIDDRDHKTGELVETIKGRPRSEAVLNLLNEQGVSFFGVRTEHGVHLFFRCPEGLERKNKQNWISLLNIKMEWKFPESDDHIPLQIGSTRREVFSDPEQIDELPVYLLPLQKGRTKPFRMDFPEGDRTNQLGGYVFHLVGRGYAVEDVFQAVRLMNDYVFDNPIPEDVLNSQILNESTFEKAAQQEQNQKTKTVSPEGFRRFISDRGVCIRYNELLNIVEYGELTGDLMQIHDIQNVMPIRLQYDFRQYTKKAISKQQITDLIVYEADINSYNPVKEYLTAVEWDRISRFPDVYDILGLTDPMEQEMVRKWFLQTAAMPFNTMEKPFQAEGVLILQGAEGIGKSRFFQQMIPVPLWFSSLDKELTTKNKDIMIQLLSVWVGEIGEIDRTFKANKSDIKNFITNRDDRIRKPYRPEPVTKARTTSFCGTTNKAIFLNDDSGSRRWWVVPIRKTKIDMGRLSDPGQLHQFWAECYAQVKADPNCFRMTRTEVTTLEERNKGLTELLPGEEELRNVLDFDAPVSVWAWTTPSALKDHPEYALERLSARDIGAAVRAIMKDVPEIRTKHSKSGNMFLIPPVKRNMNRNRLTQAELEKIQAEVEKMQENKHS